MWKRNDLSMASKKTAVIENLFFERYDPATNTLSNEVVTLEEVADAIRKWGGDLSDRNPANFLKDIVRLRTRSKNFPASVVEAGWTAEQKTGEGDCIRFIELPAGSSTAFTASRPDPALLEHPHPIQSLSLPPASRAFGRSGETWLTHVVTRLDIVHTHLSLHSPVELLGLELLQSNVKLGRAEVDAVYLGALVGGGNLLVSCEVKRRTEELDLDQIRRGSEQVASTSPDADLVLPMGLQALAGGLVWIVEFDTSFPPLRKVSEGVYRLTPSVPGIG